MALFLFAILPELIYIYIYRYPSNKHWKWMEMDRCPLFVEECGLQSRGPFPTSIDGFREGIYLVKDGEHITLCHVGYVG